MIAATQFVYIWSFQSIIADVSRGLGREEWIRLHPSAVLPADGGGQISSGDSEWDRYVRAGTERGKFGWAQLICPKNFSYPQKKSAVPHHHLHFFRHIFLSLSSAVELQRVHSGLSLRKSAIQQCQRNNTSKIDGSTTLLLLPLLRIRPPPCQRSQRQLHKLPLSQQSKKKMV